MSPEKPPIQELLSTSTTEFLLMPGIPGFNEAQRSKAETRETIKKVPYIMEYLGQIPSDLVCDDFQEMIDEIKKFYPEYYGRFTAYSCSETIEETVERAFGPMLCKLTADRESTIDGMTDCLNSEFAKVKGDIICINDIHTASYFSIEAAMETRSDKENVVPVVFCFDNHADVYEQGQNDNHVVNEGNVFIALTGNGIISGAVFMGSERPDQAVNHANKVMQEACEPQSDETFFLGIRAESLRDVQEVGNPVNRDKLRSKIRDIIAFLKDEGVTNVVLSVDIDVLGARKQRYTGFHYNPMELFIRLSKLRLPDKPANQLSLEEVEGLYARLFLGTDDIDGLKEKDGLDEEEVIAKLVEESFANPISQSVEDDNHDPKSMNLADVGIGIDTVVAECKKAGIRVGIDMVGGGRYVGDIAGLEGVDYKGYTARAAKALADRIAKSTSDIPH